MRVPLSWLRELVEIPSGEDASAIAERFVRAGLEVEAIHRPGVEVVGPLIIARVLEFETEQHKNGKSIRWCQVQADGQIRGVVCGASNFAAGDLVVLALPGASLPGGFEIAARKTYGHVSDGMICSAKELGLGDDHSGIIVLGSDAAEVGDDARAALGLDEEIIELNITPDRGYCFSMRGLAREIATAYGVKFVDPAELVTLQAVDGDAQQVAIDDSALADHIVLRTVTGVDPAAPSPAWLQRRLVASGMRSISLAVDVTNYVMLELGQPLHAFDRAKLSGTVVVRRAEAGQVLTTLDGTTRSLTSDDIVIADDSGPIGLAGTMGGASTEVDDFSTEFVLEAAHFTPALCARQARRHKLPSEAARRFERGVDPQLPAVATARAAALLAEYSGATVLGASEVDLRTARAPIRLNADLPSRLTGADYTWATVVSRLAEVGCSAVEISAGLFDVVAPSWRPDLSDPADLVEEVARLEGYDGIPTVLPIAPAGRGYTREQRLRRAAATAIAAAGYVEAPSYPFIGRPALDALQIPAEDPRRNTVRLANPLSDEEPFLRTTLLPGLLATLRRNIGRGNTNVSLFEIGSVFIADPSAPVPPRLDVAARPTPEQLDALEAALPRQPRMLAVALSGDRLPGGWWGDGTPAMWADAVEAVRTVARVVGVHIVVQAAHYPPFHPGRCAEIRLEGSGSVADGNPVIGYAGELHPRTCQSLSLPPRTVVAEIDLDRLIAASSGPVPAPRVSTYPVASFDLSFVCTSATPASSIELTLASVAGDLVESIAVFDDYQGPPLSDGERALGFTVRLRADDRTLTGADVAAVREQMIAAVAAKVGARLRSD